MANEDCVQIVSTSLLELFNLIRRTQLSVEQLTASGYFNSRPDGRITQIISDNCQTLEFAMNHYETLDITNISEQNCKELLQVITHELRTPISSIYAAVYTLHDPNLNNQRELESEELHFVEMSAYIHEINQLFLQMRDYDGF